MIRYVDDIIVVVESREESLAASRRVTELLAAIGLTLKPKKTKHLGPADDVEYLGHTISPNGVLRPNRKRESRFFDRIYALVGSLPGTLDKVVATQLAMHVSGYFKSLSHCQFSDEDYLRVAEVIKEALVSRGLQPNRLTRILYKTNPRIPTEVLEGLK